MPTTTTATPAQDTQPYAQAALEAAMQSGAYPISKPAFIFSARIPKQNSVEDKLIRYRNAVALSMGILRSVITVLVNGIPTPVPLSSRRRLLQITMQDTDVLSFIITADTELEVLNIAGQLTTVEFQQRFATACTIEGITEPSINALSVAYSFVPFAQTSAPAQPNPSPPTTSRAIPAPPPNIQVKPSCARRQGGGWSLLACVLVATAHIPALC